jgi:biotin-dependent carboxylase-like uncharacterized protein
MDVVEVLDGGFFTTVQDLGRYGYQRYGVPVAGALDQFALRVANVLVSNQEGDAGLEITLVGPRLRFLADTVIAITGAGLDPRLDDAPVAMWQAITMPQGGTLSFGSAQDGMRAYLAVAGGIDVPQVLGSRSTYTRSRLGGLEGRALAPGDRLAALGEEPAARVEGRKLPREQIPSYGQSHVLRVVLGPQDDAFSQEGLRTFLSAAYTVTPQSDRIGYRHEGPPIQHKEGADIVSDGIPFGAVQVTGDGMPILLLADRGTTGGYTKIATVISVDLGTVAQASPGDTMSFRPVIVEVAHQALRQQEDAIQQLINTPATVFARRRFRATVNGDTHDVVTALEEAIPRPPCPDTDAAPPRRIVRATVDGETHTFEVEVRGFGSQ